MTAVDKSVREFRIAFYPPSILSTILLCIAVVLTISAGTWFGTRLYLQLYGVKTQGTVKESLVQTSRTKNGDFSVSTTSYTRSLTIEYAGPDGVKRIVSGTHYSSDGSGSKFVPRVGGKVPVLYSKSNPDNAVYYDPLWHYIVPAVSLAVALYLTYLTAFLCYKDIRIMNRLSVSNWTEEQYRAFQEVAIECSDAIYHNPNDAAAYERRGDAQFAMVQFNEAVADYSQAARLRPDSSEILLKLAKAEWLEGRDRDALRDWLKSR